MDQKFPQDLIICFFGQAGVGKSWICNRFCHALLTGEILNDQELDFQDAKDTRAIFNEVYQVEVIQKKPKNFIDTLHVLKQRDIRHPSYNQFRSVEVCEAYGYGHIKVQSIQEHVKGTIFELSQQIKLKPNSLLIIVLVLYHDKPFKGEIINQVEYFEQAQNFSCIFLNRSGQIVNKFQMQMILDGYKNSRHNFLANKISVDLVSFMLNLQKYICEIVGKPNWRSDLENSIKLNQNLERCQEYMSSVQQQTKERTKTIKYNDPQMIIISLNSEELQHNLQFLQELRTQFLNVKEMIDQDLKKTEQVYEMMKLLISDIDKQDKSLVNSDSKLAVQKISDAREKLKNEAIQTVTQLTGAFKKIDELKKLASKSIFCINLDNWMNISLISESKTSIINAQQHFILKDVWLHTLTEVLSYLRLSSFVSIYLFYAAHYVGGSLLLVLPHLVFKLVDIYNLKQIIKQCSNEDTSIKFIQDNFYLEFSELFTTIDLLIDNINYKQRNQPRQK